MSTDAKNTKKRRKGLILGLAVLLISGAVGYTLANFSAQTRNPDNTFASGTLVLSNTKPLGTTCFSNDGGATDVNVNNDCDILITDGIVGPGGEVTGRVTLKNEGTIGASALGAYMAACVNSDTPAETYHGTGNVCSKAQIFVQEYSDAGFTTKSTCVYGGSTGASCDHSDASRTLSAFQAAYNNGSQLGLGAMAAGSSKYLEIGLKLPADTDSTFQGRTATFDMTWVLSQ